MSNRQTFEVLEVKIAELEMQNKNLELQILNNQNLYDAEKAELIRAKEKTEVDSEILNLFLEFSPVYFFLKDENVRAIRLSRNFEKLLGYPLEVLLNSVCKKTYKYLILCQLNSFFQSKVLSYSSQK